MEAKNEYIQTAEKFGLEVDSSLVDKIDPLTKTSMKTYVVGLLLASFSCNLDKVELRRQVMCHLSHLKSYRLTKAALPLALKQAVDQAQKYTYVP